MDHSQHNQENNDEANQVLRIAAIVMVSLKKSRNILNGCIGLNIVSRAGDIATARHHLSKDRRNMGTNISGIHKGQNLLNGNSSLKTKAIAMMG